MTCFDFINYTNLLRYFNFLLVLKKRKNVYEISLFQNVYQLDYVKSVLEIPEIKSLVLLNRLGVKKSEKPEDRRVKFLYQSAGSKSLCDDLALGDSIIFWFSLVSYAINLVFFHSVWLLSYEFFIILQAYLMLTMMYIFW